MIRSSLQLVPRYLVHNKKKTLSIALGIVLSMIMLTSMGTIINSYYERMVYVAGKTNGEYHAYFKNVEQDMIPKLVNSPLVSRIGTTLPLGTAAIGDYVLEITGCDATAAEMLNVNISKGRFPKEKNEIAIEKWIYDELPSKPAVGDTIKFEYYHKYRDGSEGKHEVAFELCGIVENALGSKATGIGKAYVSPAIATDLLVKRERYYIKYFTVNNSLPIREALNEIEAYSRKLAPGENLIGDLRKNENYITVLEGGPKAKKLTVFLDLLVAVAVIMVIYNIFNISVVERLRFFGLLRAIGITPSQIKKIIFAEALILAAIFIPVGIIAGVGAAYILLSFAGSISNISLPFIVNAFNIILPAFVGCLSVLMAVIGPANSGSKVSPIESITGTGSSVVESSGNISSGGRMNKAAERLIGYTGKLAFINLQRNRKRFWATVISISVSIALFICANYIIKCLDPFFVTSKGISADYVLTFKQFNTMQGYSEGKLTALEELAEVESVNCMKYGRCSLEMEANEMTEDGLKWYEKRAETDDYIRRKLQQGQYEIRSMFIGCNDNQYNALIKKFRIDDKTPRFFLVQNLNYQNLTKINPGDNIKVTYTYKADNIWQKKEATVRIDGLLQESPISINTRDGKAVLITSSRNIEEILGLKDYQKVEVYTKKGADSSIVEAALEKLVASDKDSKLIFFKEEMDKIRSIQSQIAVILYCLVFIIVLVGLINIANTMNMNIMIRKREFGVLRALGMTPQQLRSIILKEGLLYGLLSSVLGVILGILLIILTYFAARKGLDMVLEVDYKVILITLLATILMTTCSAVVPVKRAIAMDIVESIHAVE